MPFQLMKMAFCVTFAASKIPICYASHYSKRKRDKNGQ